MDSNLNLWYLLYGIISKKKHKINDMYITLCIYLSFDFQSIICFYVFLFQNFRERLTGINFRYILQHFVHETKQSGMRGRLLSIAQRVMDTRAYRTKTLQNY